MSMRRYWSGREDEDEDEDDEEEKAAAGTYILTPILFVNSTISLLQLLYLLHPLTPRVYFLCTPSTN